MMKGSGMSLPVCLDSTIRLMTTNNERTRGILRWINGEHLRIYGTQLEQESPQYSVEYPHQVDSTDCGIFVLTAAEYAIKGFWWTLENSWHSTWTGKPSIYCEYSQQVDSTDCGIFVLSAADYVIKGFLTFISWGHGFGFVAKATKPFHQEPEKLPKLLEKFQLTVCLSVCVSCFLSVACNPALSIRPKFL